ncbi:MAG: hypothetical protein ABI091_04035, partial [Ferruginibacter sp.]
GFEPILPTKYLLFTTPFNKLIKSNKRNENGPAVRLRICTSPRVWRGPGLVMVTMKLISTTSLFS